MKTKKSEKANLENKRGILFLLGLVSSLALALLAFEWKSEPNQVNIPEGSIIVGDDFVFIPPTTEKRPEPPKPKIELTNVDIIGNDIPVADEPEYYFPDADEPVFEFPNLSNLLPDEPVEKEDTIFIFAEQMPEFPGGEAALRSYLAKSIRYPAIAQENGVMGKVYVSFVINKSGKIEDVTLLRGEDTSLNDEALRVVNSMPDWKPGRQGEKTVKVRYTVPIVFELR